METYEMTTEVVLDTDTDGDRIYIEIGVENGDTCTDLHVEDADTALDLRLSPDEIRDLIASLERALATAEANS